MANQDENRRGISPGLVLGAGIGAAGVGAYFLSKGGKIPAAGIKSTTEDVARRIAKKASIDLTPRAFNPTAQAGIEGLIPVTEADLLGLPSAIQPLTGKLAEQHIRDISKNFITKTGIPYGPGVAPGVKGFISKDYGASTLESIQSISKRLQAHVAGTTGSEFRVTPGWGAELTIQAGRATRTFELPLQAGHQLHVTGRTYEAGQYILGGKGAERVTHFMDAFDHILGMKLGTRQSSLEEVEKMYRAAHSEMMSTVAMSDITAMGAAPSPMSVRTAAYRGRVTHLGLREEGELFQRAVTPGQVQRLMEAYPHIKPASGMKFNRPEQAFGAVVWDRIQGMKSNVRQQIGLTSLEDVQNFISTQGTMKGSQLLQGVFQSPALGLSQLSGLTFEDPGAAGGRFLRGATFTKTAQQIKGLKDVGISPNFFVGGPAIHELNKVMGAQNALYGFRTPMLVSLDPEFNMLTGLSGEGGFMTSNKLRNAMKTRVEVGFQIPLTEGKTMLGEKTFAALKAGRPATLRPGEAIGLGKFYTPAFNDMAAEDMLKLGMGPDDAVRLLRAQEPTHITRAVFNPEAGMIALQGHINAPSASFSVMGVHGAVAKTYGVGAARELGALAGLAPGKGVHVITGVKSLKEPEILQGLYAGLLEQAKPGQQAGLRRRIESLGMERGLTLERYQELAKEYGIRADVKLRGAQLAPVFEEMGYSAEEIRGLGSKEFMVLGGQISAGQEWEMRASKGLHGGFTAEGRPDLGGFEWKIGQLRQKGAPAKEIAAVERAMRRQAIATKTIKPMSLGTQELMMLGFHASEGYSEVQKTLFGIGAKQYGTRGLELATYLGQFGDKASGLRLNPEALKLRTIKLGSDPAKRIAAEAQRVLGMVEEGRLVGPETSWLFNPKTKGFLLETPGLEFDVTSTAMGKGGQVVTTGGLKVGGKQKLYVPSISEAVAPWRAGEYLDPIVKAKIGLLSQIGEGARDEYARGFVGSRLGGAFNELTAAQLASFSKGGGWRDIFGERITPGVEGVGGASGYFRAMEQGMVPWKNRFAALSGVEQAEYNLRLLSDPSGAAAYMRERLANTAFVAPERIYGAGAEFAQAAGRGEAYGILGSWPATSAGAVSVTRFAPANIQARAIGLPGGRWAAAARDVDGDRAGAFFFKDALTDPHAKDAMQKAYRHSHERAILSEKYLYSKIEKDVADATFSNAVVANIRETAGETAYEQLAGKFGRGRELASKVLELRVATELGVGYNTNRLLDQMQMLQNIVEKNPGRKAAAEAAIDMLGFTVYEGRIKMRKWATKGSGTKMFADQLWDLLESDNPNANAIASLLDDASAAAQKAALGQGATAEQKALAAQFKTFSGAPGTGWGEYIRTPGSSKEMASLLMESHMEVARSHNAADLAMQTELLRRSRQTMGSEDAAKLMVSLTESGAEVPGLASRITGKVTNKALIEDVFLQNVREAAGQAGTVGTKYAATGAGQKAASRLQDWLGKIPDEAWPKVGIGAAAALGVFMLGRTLSGMKSAPPSPPTPLDQDRRGLGDGETTGQQHVYMRQDRGMMERNQGIERISVGGMTNMENLQRLSQYGTMDMRVRDDSMSDSQYRRQLELNQSSRFRMR